MPILASAAGYGLRPVGMVGGAPYNGSFEEIPVNVATGTVISAGNLLTISSAGAISAHVGSGLTAGTAGVLGVCVGVTYTDAKGAFTVGTYLASGVYGTNNAAYQNPTLQVVTDPNVVYSVLANNAASKDAIDASGVQLSIGGKAYLSTIAASDASVFGHATGLLTTIGTANTSALTIVAAPIDSVQDAKTNYSTANWVADLRVRISPSLHVATAATGI